jgi:hypothetical protein
MHETLRPSCNLELMQHVSASCYGQILPVPGEEEAWWEAIPAGLRDRLETIGI